MKRKELKNLAKKIAELEKIIQAGEDPQAVNRAENEIMKLSASVGSLEDMAIIDEMVMEIFEKT